MNSTIFPIVEVQENKLISVDGNIGNFYEIIAPDIEQISPFEVDRFYEGVSGSLNNFEDGSYFKFYKLGKRSFVDTNSYCAPSLHGIQVKPSSDHLSLFFGAEDLFSEVGIFDDYLLVNGQYLKILSVCSFSEDEIDESIIPVDVDYVLNIKKIPNEVSLKKLDRIRTKHLSSFLKSKRDISSEGAYDQAEEFLNDLTFGKESMFEMELFFILKGNTAYDVNQNAKELQSHMASKGIKLYLEGQSPLKGKSGISLIFNELIPGVFPKLRLREHLNKTSHLRYLLPLRRTSLMDSGIKFHDQNDDEVFFNPFSKDIKNRNMLVTGLSGGGKSVFVNKVVHSLIASHPTVILDKGGSFKRLTNYHGGIELNKGFNPMQFKDPMYLREFILSVVDKNKFDKLNCGKLLGEIKTFLEKNPDGDFNSLLDSLATSFEGIHFYFEDIKDFFTNEKLSEFPILYVDVENYPKNIISPLIIFILEYFKNIPEREKILVFDECWSFLVHHAEFIDECFRTFRKSGAFPIAISQGLNDFKMLGDELCNSITNNSYFKIFFPQELETSNEITEFDIFNLGSLQFEKGNYSDCYLKSTDNRYRKNIRTFLTPLELELFHTEAGEDDHLNLFIKKNRDFFKSNKEATNAFIGLKYGQNTNSFNDSNSFIWS
ncbi:hypothetical protein OAT67_04575 [Bacteriovoracaceae bacterium]|nr:hypothetical protein [Bacteriovoracaceae bacterium]